MSNHKQQPRSTTQNNNHDDNQIKSSNICLLMCVCERGEGPPPPPNPLTAFSFDMFILATIPTRKYMCILLFWDLNYEYNTHILTWTILSTIDFELDTCSSRFSQEFSCNRYEYKYVKNLLVNAFEFNTNTYTSKNHREFEMYLFPRAWYILSPPLVCVFLVGYISVLGQLSHVLFLSVLFLAQTEQMRWAGDSRTTGARGRLSAGRGGGYMMFLLGGQHGNFPPSRRLKFVQYRTGVSICHRSPSPDSSPSTG